MDSSKSTDKPFVISKELVWEAYQRVRANKGAAGVDGVTIEDFEKDLKNNLYRIWNRMSSGTYFPPAVKAVEIPKPAGRGVRVLGVPTVADRIAQTVAAMTMEPRMAELFHSDSYGYRVGRSALQAVETCWDRCQKRDWVIDLDIQDFFGSVDHDLTLKAVEVNLRPDQKWVLLYVRRWLTAPVQHPDRRRVVPDRGTPQGSAISPALANLFLHYALDAWLAREYPAVWFERYVDDAVVHCATRRQAVEIRGAIGRRLAVLRRTSPRPRLNWADRAVLAALIRRLPKPVNGKPFLAVGSPGGASIITTVLQILINRIDFGMSLPDAIAAPRASQRNSTTRQAEPDFIARPTTPGLEALGQQFAVTTMSPLDPSIQIPPTIGAATGLEFLGHGEVLAAGETDAAGRKFCRRRVPAFRERTLKPR